MISSICQNQTADSDSELTPFSGATGAPQWVGCVRHCQPFSTFHCERVPTLWFRSLPFHWLFCGISNLLGWQSHPMPVAMGSWGSSGLLRAFSQSKSPLFCADGGWEVTGGHLSLILSLSPSFSLYSSSSPPSNYLALSVHLYVSLPSSISLAHWLTLPSLSDSPRQGATLGHKTDGDYKG